MKFHVIEGNTQRLDGGAMFGNAPKALWERWIAPDAQNRIPLACRALLLQTDDGRHFLFETGIGAHFEPKLRERYGVVEEEHMLLKNLAAIGIKPSDIDAVILSHLHFDHAGGLLPAYGEEPRLVFPNAKYYVGKKHWERAQNPHIRERASFLPIIPQLLFQADLTLIEGESHPDLPCHFHYSDGHTIGLMMAQIESFLFISDLAPGLPWVHLPITMGYDRFPERIVDEKKALFEKLLPQKMKLFFTHDPTTPCAQLQQDEKGRFVGLPCEVSL